MNDLEAQLRSWAPRRPSASLERRLFAPRPAMAETLPAFRLDWLAPATVGLMLLGLFLSHHSNPFLSPSNAGPMVAVILSNQSAAAFIAGNLSRTENRLPADAYEWTVRNGTTSPVSAVFDSRRRW